MLSAMPQVHSMRCDCGIQHKILLYLTAGARRAWDLHPKLPLHQQIGDPISAVPHTARTASPAADRAHNPGCMWGTAKIVDPGSSRTVIYQPWRTWEAPHGCYDLPATGYVEHFRVWEITADTIFQLQGFSMQPGGWEITATPSLHGERSILT